MEEVPAALSRTLQACGHALCQICLERIVRDGAAATTVPLGCPIPECRVQLQGTELQLFLTPAEVTALTDAMLAVLLGPTAMHCPTRTAGC